MYVIIFEISLWMLNSDPIHHTLILLEWNLRLGIWLILSAADQFLMMAATVCSSWVAVNAGTSRRSRIFPEGDESKAYIRSANAMCSRTPKYQNRMHINISLYLGDDANHYAHWFASLLQQIHDLYTHTDFYIVHGFLKFPSTLRARPDSSKPARTCLLNVLAVIAGGTILVEQPGSSVMEFYNRFRWMCGLFPVA